MHRLMVAALLGCAALASYAEDAAREREHRAHGMQVFDAQGQRVGRLTSLGGTDGVLLNMNGVPLFAAIERRSTSGGTSATDFQWAASSVLSYASPGCSGAPLVRYDANSDPNLFRQQAARPSLAVRSGADVTLYFAGDGYSATTLNVSGYTVEHGCEALSAAPREVCEAGCVWPPSHAYVLPKVLQAWPAAGTFELTRRYPEPLRIGER